MNQLEIFGPVLVLIVLTWVVLAYMYARRIPFIRSLNIDLNQLTPAEFAGRSPPSVSNPSDNLKNLFEVPVIFYVLALYLYLSAQVDSVYLIGSWAFVLLRVLHSAIHCIINIVILRFVVYVISCIILFSMTVRAAIAFFL